MSAVNTENRGKHSVPVVSAPGVPQTTAVKASSLPLVFDPRRREPRLQHSSPTVGQLLRGETKSPRSIGKLPDTRAPLTSTTSAERNTTAGRPLLRASNTSLKAPEQRRLSDTLLSDMPQTTARAYGTESDSNTQLVETHSKTKQPRDDEMEAILSSADVPPGLLVSQTAPRTVSGSAAPLHTTEEVLRHTQTSPRHSDANPLAPRAVSLNQNEETDTSRLTTVVPLESIENVSPKWNRECEWLQAPILFYFFASLIEFRELQESYLSDGQFTDRAHELLLELDTFESRITYSVDEISGILLNRVFASWSNPAVRKRVQDVVDEWTNSGPRSDGFRDTSLALIDDISEDRACTITYSQFYVFRQYVGNREHYRFALGMSSAGLLLSIVCIVLLGVFGRKHVVACIVLSVVLGLVAILGHILCLLLLHHNYYADSAEKFFRAESLSVTKDDINDDDESIRNLWMAPLGSLPHPSSGDRTVSDRVIENSRQDTDNTLRMSPLNYEKNQMNVSQLQAQIVRRSISASEGDLRSASVDSLIGKNSSQQIVNSLTESISVTALLYCNDRDMVESVSITLWKNNFCVFCSTDVTALDAAYRRGSERFKVILVAARDLGTNGARLKTALDWVEARRPIFFFSDSEANFPELVPMSARVHVPLTAMDVRRILLAGIAISEEDTPLRDDPNGNVPNYTLGRRLGGGAFGNVFEAQLEGTGANCAVKRMYLKASTDDNAETDGPSKQLRDIAQEVEIMSSLTHPNIVQYLFCQRDDNCISIFMELCSGGSLSSMIKRGDINDAESIKRILTEILRAVSYLHNKRIVHRDLKPDNVLFRNSHAKLTDFGTAVHKRGELNMVTGTFAYMAPEILVGESYGKACDIWSVGCIAAEMLSIDLPQRGMGPPEMATFYRQMPMDSALDIQCDRPDVVSFLQTCLQRNPANRATAGSLLTHRMLSKESSDIAFWLVEVSHKKKLKRQQSTGLTHNSSFDLNSSDMSLNSNQ